MTSYRVVQPIDVIKSQRTTQDVIRRYSTHDVMRCYSTNGVISRYSVKGGNIHVLHLPTARTPKFPQSTRTTEFPWKLCSHNQVPSLCAHTHALSAMTTTTHTVRSRQRPYHAGPTASLPYSEVKQRWVRIVLRWVTAWEHRMPLASFFAVLDVSDL